MTASDDFSSPTLNPDWSFVGGPNTGVAVDENGDDAFLVLNTPDGEYDMWGKNRQAARVLQTADNDDFRIGAHFLSTPTERFQMQGLVVEGSDNKWLRVDTYFDLRLFAAVTDGNASTKVMSIKIPGGVAPYLALERVGDTFTVSYSLNGSSYTNAGSFNFAMTVDEVGVFAGNTGDSNGFAAVVDWFEIDSDPLTDEDGSLGGGGTDPVAGDDFITADHDGVDIVVADLLGNDSAPGGGSLSLVSFTDPPHGTLVDNGDGTLSYVPDAGFSGEDTFEYTVSDGTNEDVAKAWAYARSPFPPRRARWSSPPTTFPAECFRRSGRWRENPARARRSRPWAATGSCGSPRRAALTTCGATTTMPAG